MAVNYEVDPDFYFFGHPWRRNNPLSCGVNWRASNTHSVTKTNRVRIPIYSYSASICNFDAALFGSLLRNQIDMFSLHSKILHDI